MKEQGIIENFHELFFEVININDILILYKFHQDIPQKYHKDFQYVLENFDICEIHDIINNLNDITKITVEETLGITQYINALLLYLIDIKNCGFVIWWKDNNPELYYIEMTDQIIFKNKCLFEDFLQLNLNNNQRIDYETD